MQAIRGYLEDERFIPYEFVILPKRTEAILVIQDMTKLLKHDSDKEWLNEFHHLISNSVGEELLDETFPRMHISRDVDALEDEGRTN